MTAPERQKVLFVGGLGRSGSTLIESLLNEVPQILAVGETIHLWERGIANDERCACGEPFSRCPHWSAVGKEAFGGWDQVDLDEIVGLRWSIDRSRRLPLIVAHHRRGRPSRAECRYLDHLSAVVLGAATVAAERTGDRPEVVLETSKHLSTAALLALDDRLDVRILHLVRDPRGVAHSWTKEVVRPETEGELMPTYRPVRTATRWVTDNTGFELLALRVPTLTVTYENFVGDPVRWLTAIGDLAGLDSASLDFGFIQCTRATVSAPLHSVAGNPLRFGDRTLALRLDDAWRRELSLRHRLLVSAVATPLRSRYGYRRRRRR
jgi:hypothetical protein